GGRGRRPQPPGPPRRWELRCCSRTRDLTSEKTSPFRAAHARAARQTHDPHKRTPRITCAVPNGPELGRKARQHRRNRVMHSPSPGEVEPSLAAWEQFLHESKLPPLVTIGLAHYQFEAIHAFLDGNGRVGRLLITLFLIERQILPTPLLY